MESKLCKSKYINLQRQLLPQPQGKLKQAVLGQYIAWFKRMVTNEYIRNVKNRNWPRFNGRLWQRNYYEHIVRSGEKLQQFRRYIQNNPINWRNDTFFVP